KLPPRHAGSMSGGGAEAVIGSFPHRGRMNVHLLLTDRPFVEFASRKLDIEGLYPHPTPCVLGHESAGFVEAVGDGVTCAKPAEQASQLFVSFTMAEDARADYFLTNRSVPTG